MQIQQNISLKPYNTFRVDVQARNFSSFSGYDELHELIDQNPSLPVFILGGGSNILFTKDVEGLVLKNEIMGIEVIHEDNEHVFVRAGAGENWHQFVLHCLDHNWAGIENLSLIPGCVGAAPIQNIGAYGVELQEVFFSLEAYDIQEKKICTFTPADCEFGYRESVFKNHLRGQMIILNITVRLRKTPIFHTSYGSLKEELEKMGVQDLTIKAVSRAVISIRMQKLPDPAQIPNAGSFFKNPVINPDQFSALKSKYQTIPSYPQADGRIKLAAAWLIEQCGWKGYRKGDAGCHEKQALVLVNYGKATGMEIYDLSEEILRSVESEFGILLEREVNIL